MLSSVKNIVPISKVKSELNITDATLERFINKNYLKIRVVNDEVFVCKVSYKQFKSNGKLVGYQVI